MARYTQLNEHWTSKIGGVIWWIAGPRMMISFSAGMLLSDWPLLPAALVLLIIGIVLMVIKTYFVHSTA